MSALRAGLLSSRGSGRELWAVGLIAHSPGCKVRRMGFLGRGSSQSNQMSVAGWTAIGMPITSVPLGAGTSLS